MISSRRLLKHQWTRGISLARKLSVQLTGYEPYDYGTVKNPSQSFQSDLAKVSSDPSRIRNFSIIAHVDHGKSTLADRMLEIAGNINAEQRQQAQVLDTLEVERERGITVKAQTCSIIFRRQENGVDKTYLINLVDTPGHVDFSYEVRRSLMACSGALLLVDCSQGIQAQTLATHRAAAQESLKIIPVLTKIDLPNSNPEDVMLSMADTFALDPDAIVLTSAKSGSGIFDLFDRIIDEFPPPKGKKDCPLRVRIIDSWYDQYRGVISLVEVADGILREGDQITPLALSGFDNTTVPKNARFEVQEVGILLPGKRRTGALNNGQVGYLVCGMWTAKDAMAGDTIIHVGDKAKFVRDSDMSNGSRKEEPLPGFTMPKSMVFASIYPVDDSSFEELRTAIDKLTLNDASVTISTESSDALGAL